MSTATPRQDPIVLAGVVGERVTIRSANPRNYHQAVTDPGSSEVIDIEAHLFVPGPIGGARVPAVIVVPGSLGIAPSHLAHAQQFVEHGFASLVLDPFGARAVTSTVANQTQYSFAASAYDVCAAVAYLAAHPRVDPTRIGAQGHSRGGSAVLTAATRAFAPAHDAPRLRAVYAAYPWCGHRFADPDVGATLVRAIIGELDEWCSPEEVRAHIDALVALGCAATFRLVAGAQHSFDRGTAVELVADASVAPLAPTILLAADGSMIDPATGEASPDWTDRHFMVAAIKAGHGRRGARIGSSGDIAEVFRADMLAFWTDVLATG